MANNKYDFSGWATKCNIKCSDGRTIKPGAFKGDNGRTVPLVWMHMHDDPENVLGHAYLEDVPGKGTYAYCTLNNLPKARAVKEAVHNGDVTALSIYANQLQQDSAKNVMHGRIREVSVVLAGANDGAMILEHSDTGNADAVIYSNFGEDNISDEAGEVVEHADKDDEETMDEEEQEKKEDTKVEDKKERTVKDVYDAMTDEQKDVVAFLVGQAIEDERSGKKKKNPVNQDEDEETEDEDEEMVEHSVFDQDNDESTDFLSHADQGEIIGMAKQPGMTFQSALQNYLENERGLSHADSADAVSGFDDSKAVYDGKNSLQLMFPDFKEAKDGMPQVIRNDQGWVTVVLNKVKKAPYSRVRTTQVDIRKLDDLRAKGYKKGTKKDLAGKYSLIRRTTDPQTVYVRSSLNNDDVADITDFDYVSYQYNEIDRPQLNEEVATAIMIGDGRDDSAADKIFPDHIRPIWTDDDLYVKHVDVDIAAAKKALQGSDTSAHFGDSYIYAEAILEALLHARETDWYGNGTSDMFCTPHLANQMMLARDFNGRRLYDNRSQLAAALDVGNIYTAEQFNDKIRTDSKGKKHRLLAIVGNLQDYQVGSTKGGQIAHFTNFNLDFNQHQSLIETRLSGATISIYSFIVLEEPVEDGASAGTGVGA